VVAELPRTPLVRSPQNPASRSFVNRTRPQGPYWDLLGEGADRCGCSFDPALGAVSSTGASDPRPSKRLLTSEVSSWRGWWTPR